MFLCDPPHGRRGGVLDFDPVVVAPRAIGRAKPFSKRCPRNRAALAFSDISHFNHPALAMRWKASVHMPVWPAR